MGLPVLSKSWFLVPNVDSTTSYPQALFDRKQILKGVAFGGKSISANAWTVVGSSNSITSNMSGTDLLVSSANVIRGANTSTARSWIVLRNVKGRQMLIDYVSATADTCRVQFSPAAGFTGGSTTAAPTATDVIDIIDAGPAAQVADVAVVTKILQNVWQTTDGAQTMIVSVQNGACITLWLFGDVEDPPASWTTPFISYWDFGTGTSSSACWARKMVGVFGTGHANARANSTTTATVYMVGEALDEGAGPNPLFESSSACNRQNELSVTWDVYDHFELFSENVNLWGPLGYWPDLWPSATTRAGYATGDHLPGDGSRQFVRVNDLVFWWGGNAAMVLS
jgi:hypothetical protein